MILAFLIIFIKSLTLKINQIEYTNDTFDDILEQYQLTIDTIISIVVQEGNFPVNSLSREYSQLTTLEVPIDCFSGPINDNLFQNMDVLKTVIIEGATTIGISSFQNCSQLETVRFSSCVHVNSKSFQSCSLLKSVTMPQLRTIDSYAFAGTSLSSIEFNELSKIGDYSFSDCSLLSQITAPLIEFIGSYCFKNTAFTILEFDNLLEMGTNGHCFDSCTKLEIINLGQIDELKPYSFNGCISLHTISCDNVSIIKEYCFCSCSKLATTIFPVLKTIENNVFQGISTITEVNFPDVVFIGASAYENCIGLKTVVLNSCITIREKAFKDCISLSRIEIPELYNIYHSAFYNTDIETVEFPRLQTLYISTVDGIKNFGGYFKNCKRLRSFTAPLANCIAIQMFYSCSSLSSLNMDKAETIYSNGIYGCSDLSYLRLPKLSYVDDDQFTKYNNFVHLELNSVVSVGSYAFENCKNLETVVMHRCVTLYRYAFNGCNKLYSIDMPNLKTISACVFAYTALVSVELNNLTIADYVSPSGNTKGNHFQGCELLVNVTMKKLTYIQYQMFISCSQLSYIDAPLINSIGYNAFSGCHNFSNISFPVLNSINDEAFESCSGITSIDIPSLTIINDESFAYCKNLKSVSLESCTYIGVMAFYYCSKLEYIYLPNLTEISNRAFAYTSLTNIELNSLTKVTTTKYSNLGTTGDHFSNCQLLVNVTMKKLSYIQYRMFASCSQLQYVDAPYVTSIGYESFRGCNSYSNITFPVLNSINSDSFYDNSVITNINFSSIITINDESFAYCRNLKSVSLESCTYIGVMAFYYCSKLEYIYLPNLTEISNRAFAYTSLTNIELNSLTKVTTTKYSSSGTIGDHFSNCQLLVNVTMKKLTYIQYEMFISCSQLSYIDAPLINSIGYNAFSGCHNFSNISFPVLNSINDEAFESCSGITSIDIPSLTIINDESFAYCKNLKSVSLESCTYIGVMAFYYCSKLEYIYLPNLTEISNRAFAYTSLTNIELNSLTKVTTTKYSNLGTTGDHFSNCQLLVNVTMKKLSYIQYRMFASCSQLQYVDAPYVTSIGYESFRGCNIYSNITFPIINDVGTNSFYGNSGIIDIKLSTLTTIGDYAFSYCNNLRSFSAENCTYINDNAFYYSSKLETVYFPNLREIEGRAFAYTALRKVEMNSLTTAYTYTLSGTLYSNHFHGCKYLSKVVMKSLTSVSRNMFYSCTMLTEIDMPSVVEINMEGFNGCSSLTIAKLDSCTSMSSNCFLGCNNIRTISLGYNSIYFGLIPNPKALTHISFPKALNVPDNAFFYYTEMISCKLPIASKIGSSSFEGCTKLLNLEIPSVIEINGDRTFYNCENLNSLAFRSLVTVNSSCPNLFQGCRGLQYISLPDRPPKTFHRDTFQELSCNVYIPSDSLSIYDDDESVDGDTKGDLKWCGIELLKHEFIKIIGDGIEGTGVTLSDACASTGLIQSEIKNLRILTGYLSQEVLKSFNANFINLNELILDSNVSIEEEKIPKKFLFNHNQIKIVCFFCSIRLIEESAFEGCTQLNSIRSAAKELESRCFYGPTLLETISLKFVDTLTGSNFFSNNPVLTSIELPKLEFASVTGYISENSPQLKSITLPENPPTFMNGNFLLDVCPNLEGVSNEALINYDAADEIDNDMKYYSINLTYTLIVCSVDGESKGGLNLKNLINEGAKIVEIISGDIKESDLILPKSIISFTMRENTTLESIPSNAFSHNSNLQIVNIYTNNDFVIKEEAFSFCTSLESVLIKGAKTIQGLTFKGDYQLKTVILNDIETMNGNFHFDGCYKLVSISFQSLKTVSQQSSMIFLGCSQLTTIKLPSIPPKTFNKDVFHGLENNITLSLPNESDFSIYDDDISIDGDMKQDGLWCGLLLPSAIIYIKINKRNNVFKGLRLSECIATSCIPESSITTLEITRGVIQISLLLETVKKLPFLETLTISKSVVFRGEFTKGLFSGLNLVSISLPSITIIPEEFFKDCIKLKDVSIIDAKKVCASSFKGCISLESIDLNVDTLEGDSIFEGCKSLSTVVLSNLVSVDSSAANIFSNCPLISISLPSTPPKTFNKRTFIGMNVVLSGLTNDELRNYDSNIDVENDEKDDLKWCGISLVQLYITVSINEKPSVNCSMIADAIPLNSISEVKSIEITQGMVKKTHLEELRCFAELLRLTITENAILESSILESGQFENMTSLIHVKIMHNVLIMSYCFNGCTSLMSIEFKEVSLLSEGSFRNCTSLNTIKIPFCKELRGDFIFAGCSSLRDVDLSYLLTVDSSAFNIFEGCDQLTMIRLPSKEPLVFHKNTFIHCPDVILILPNKNDYLAYDDQSHVVDDVKEDEKWCGIKIDSAFLPPFLTYKINNIEYKSRKLMDFQIQGDSVNLLEINNDKNAEYSEIKSLELIGGLVESAELKEMIRKSPLIENFEAHIGTLNEIASETFSNNNLLKEIVIHTEIYISYGSLQNIPSLEVLKMDLQQSIRNDDLFGDINLREISFPLLTTIPSKTFANLAKLTSIQLDTASILHKECFKNCVSIENIELSNIRIIDGDSHFEGCSNLKTIDLSSLSSVHQSASHIFMNCNKLSTLKLGIEPPTIFNEDVFNNAGILPYISIPSEIGWQNYIPQCTINKDNNHYIWYGFDTGLIKEETDGPKCSQIQFPTSYETSIYYSNSITMTIEMTMTYVLRKSVSYSMGLTISNTLIGTYISGVYTMIESGSYYYIYRPYIIQFYSLTNSPSFIILEVFKPKKRLTPEMIIGISCGSTAVFFIILTCMIFYCRQLKEERLNDLYDFSISEDDIQYNEKDNNEKTKVENAENENENKPTVKIIEASNDDSDSDLNYWI